LGTRLKPVLRDRPKILAPVAGRPFIDHLLQWLESQRVRRIVFSLGHQSARVVEHLSSRNHAPLDIRTVVEPEPLGTAGGLALARPLLDSDPAIVINGDSLVDVDLAALVAAHRAASAEASIVAARVADGRRFGKLVIRPDGRIEAFREKTPQDPRRAGWINAGVYAFSATALDRVRALGGGSLERDFFAACPPGSLLAFRTTGRFLDIGTPDALADAEAWFRDSSNPSLRIARHDHKPHSIQDLVSRRRDGLPEMVPQARRCRSRRNDQ
jgi:mannose-1-phosphate guanylyltransferase